jgi:hypothetical protein
LKRAGGNEYIVLERSDGKGIGIYEWVFDYHEKKGELMDKAGICCLGMGGWQ